MPAREHRWEAEEDHTLEDVTVCFIRGCHALNETQYVHQPLALVIRQRAWVQIRVRGADLLDQDCNDAECVP